MLCDRFGYAFLASTHHTSSCRAFGWVCVCPTIMAQWNLWRKHFYLWIFFWPRHAQNCLMIIWISDLSAMVNQIFQLTALGYHCQCGHIQNSIVYYVFFFSFLSYSSLESISYLDVPSSCRCCWCVFWFFLSAEMPAFFFLRQIVNFRFSSLYIIVITINSILKIVHRLNTIAFEYS